MRFRSLTTRFALATAVLVVVSLGALSTLAITVGRHSVGAQVRAGNSTSAALAARAFEQYVLGSVRIVEEASQRPKLSQEIRAANWPLLVEDEEEVRALARELLEMDGYTILEALSPEEALRLSAEHPGPIHLLLTDVVMPQMSGPELAQRLRARRPDIKVLCMSGYPELPTVPQETLNTAWLQKPFTPASLSDEVRRVLDAPSR